MKGSHPTLVPGFDPDEIACQYAQVMRTLPRGKRKPDIALQLQARLINRYGQVQAEKHIQGALEAYELLIPPPQEV